VTSIVLLTPTYLIFVLMLLKGMTDPTRVRSYIIFVIFNYLVLAFVAFNTDRNKRLQYLTLKNSTNERQSLEEVLEAINPGVVILGINKQDKR